MLPHVPLICFVKNHAREAHLTGIFRTQPNWLLKCCKNENSYDMKIYFHSIKITFYLIKYIFIISPFLYDIKYISFQSNKFVFSKKRFYHIYFFHSSKIYFYYMNFLFNNFPVSTSGLPFLFTKERILLSVYKLNNSTRMWKSF